MQTKVSTSELKVGMFVSLLDRPWLDTPFLFQGLLIESEKEISLLQKYCEFVYVDWGRSTLRYDAVKLTPLETARPLAATHAHVPSETRSASSTKITPPQTSHDSGVPEMRITRKNNESVPVSPSEKQPAGTAKTDPGNTTRNFSVDNPSRKDTPTGIFGKIKKLFRGGALKTQRHSGEDTGDAEEERPDFIPASIRLSVYEEARAVEDEVEPAINAHQRIKTALENLVQNIKTSKPFVVEETKEVIQEVVNSMIRNPDAMMWITRLRKQDEFAYGHSLQVSVYLVALGRHLGLPKDYLERICMLGLLIDIGKAKLPKELLHKQGRLTSEEFELVKHHVQHALDILEETPGIHPDVLQGIAQHHEREDGSGYPKGLQREEISLFGRMTAIVDSFVALTNQRTYAQPIPVYEALQHICNFKPGLYQASMVEQFIQAIGVFPVGSMVELSSGEVAVVISHSKVRRLKPRVLVISDADKLPLQQPFTLDLLKLHDANENPLFIRRGLPSGEFGLDAREYYLA